MCKCQPIGFSSISLHDLFEHCDNLSYESVCNYESDPQVANNILYYLAYSKDIEFNAKECYKCMLDRDSEDYLYTYLNINNKEHNLFSKRFKLLASNNKAYELATKINPSVADLEEFSKIDPCFSVLFPLKRYLASHLELSVTYRGMLPFGKEVVAYYNGIVPQNWKIKGSPTFKDYTRLRDISNKKAILMGVPTLTINNLMYSFGRVITDVNNNGISDLNDL